MKKIKHPIGFVLLILLYCVWAYLCYVVLSLTAIGAYGSLFIGFAIIWMTNLEGKDQLVGCLGTALIDIIVPALIDIIISNDSLEGKIISLIISAIALFVIIGIPFMVIGSYLKKHNKTWDDTLIDQEIPEVQDELWQAKRDCLKLAKYTAVFSNLAICIEGVFYFSIPCFLLSAYCCDEMVPEDCIFYGNPLTYFWVTLGLLVLYVPILLTAVILWKILEYRCYKNGLSLSGLDNIYDKARRMNMYVNVAKRHGGVALAGGIFRRILASTNDFLINEGEKPVNSKAYRTVMWCLNGLQLLFVVGLHIYAILY